MLRPSIDRLADYVLAGGEILWPTLPAGTSAASQRPPAAVSDAAVAALATARGLDARRLRTWTEQLAQAALSSSHPLHRFALAAASADRAAAADLRPDASGAARPPGQVIVDYADPAARWYADGFAFGLHPARPGDLLPAADAAAPLRLVTVSAARRDPAWLGLQNAPGAELDFDRVGKQERPGQTLRTPEVTLASGKLWYRVRGTGRAYAVVNSHLLVSGPLHGQTLLEWQTKSDGAAADDWQWIGHDLSEYAGHRVHIEFSPIAAESLAIARVIDSPQRPAPDEDVTGALPAVEPGASLEKLAAVCQESFARAVARLADQKVDGPA